MSDPAVNEDLPEAVVQFLKRLEHLTGRIPMARAVMVILTAGMLLTVTVMGAVWWAEQYRVRQAFEASAFRLQTLMQVRLDTRVAMAAQMARWASTSSPLLSVGKSEVWTAQGLTLIDDRGWRAGRLPALLGIGASGAQALQSCMAASPPGQVASLCQAPGAGTDAPHWFYVQRVHAPVGGWVLMALSPGSVSTMFDDGMFWRMHGELLDAQDAAAPLRREGQVRHFQLGVANTGATLPVRLSGEERPLSWLDAWTRQTGMWVAGTAGLLFTLAGLHVYLMLVSTRRRAREMAGEMSAVLQRNQSRNQAVMDTAPDAIVMTDGSGRVSWCNQATTSIFGRALADLEGQAIGVVLPAIGATDVAAWFDTHGISNRVIGFETTGVRAEGTAFPVAVSASRVALNGEQILTFIVRDTTDAKWAEQALLLRDRALASSADGVIIASMTMPHQPVIYVNRAFEHITGYEAHEVLGRNCSMLQRGDVAQSAIAEMREAIRKGEGCKVVLRNYRKDGSLFYNELAISPVLTQEGLLTHYVGVQTDITERIAAEQVLHSRTERLNAVFDLSPDGFVVLDRRGEVSIVNPAFERMTGMQAADMVGRTRGAFEEALGAHCKAIEPYGQDPAASAMLLHLHTPTVRTLVQRVRQGGQDSETVMYFRDITHELEVDRMKSEFLAMAAHELRTPMVSIFGFTELLLKRPFNEERRNDMLGTIHRQASILINLVNELLDLARIEARRGKDFKREVQAIGPIVRQALEGLKVPGDRRKVRVHMDAPERLVCADTDKLGQAVLNVLSNAYKYSPQGGEIHLRVWHDDAARCCHIEVQDHGIGMSPEQLGRVFERFFRADPSGNIPGTGLGMCLVKEIIGLHQGQVAVHSTLGEGTTVRLTLPAACGATDRAPESRGVLADTKVSPG